MKQTHCPLLFGQLPEATAVPRCNSSRLNRRVLCCALRFSLAGHEGLHSAGRGRFLRDGQQRPGSGAGGTGSGQGQTDLRTLPCGFEFILRAG